LSLLHHAFASFLLSRFLSLFHVVPFHSLS
jgi:hypothetical protein